MAIYQRKVWVAIAGILVIVLIYTGATYNSLVKRDENVHLTWGNLQNAYQRRLDLIPNLVIVVKGSSDYERQTLQQLADARANAQQGDNRVRRRIGSRTIIDGRNRRRQQWYYLSIK